MNKGAEEEEEADLITPAAETPPPTPASPAA
jgi:hypothetical protein